MARVLAMEVLGSGLSNASHHEDALSVMEAELARKRRLGASQHNILVAQSNLANTYQFLGRLDEALLSRRDVYSGFLKLLGEEHGDTLVTANNYAKSLKDLERFEEAKSLLRKTIPVARRVLGDRNDTTLRMRSMYAVTLYQHDSATLNDIRGAVATLEDTQRTARRVLGSAHPLFGSIERDLQNARATLRARESGQSVVFNPR